MHNNAFDDEGLIQEFESEKFDLPDNVVGSLVAVNIHAIYANNDNEELYSDVQTFTDRPATPETNDVYYNSFGE